MPVRDVAKSVSFYANVIPWPCYLQGDRETNSLAGLCFVRWGELESRATTIAFTLVQQKETDGAALERPLDVCFAYADVDAAYRRAVENGAIPVSPPVAKSWW